jgi:hypothetical protein
MATGLLAIVGSVTPPGRLLNATRWLLDSASASRKDLEVDLINLADKKVAFADGRPPEQYKDDTAAIIESVRAADGVIIASPVYRGSFTGALKNLLDHLPLESLAAKPVWNCRDGRDSTSLSRRRLASARRPRMVRGAGSADKRVSRIGRFREWSAYRWCKAGPQRSR